MTQRFTIDGSDALEARLGERCRRAQERILAAIPRQSVHALLLGGGYGRGEGGVLKTASGDAPYNDLEFYVLLRGNDLLNRKRFGSAVHHIAEELTKEAGIEVEFKLISLRKFEQSTVNMFYYDLVSGHRLVYGNEQWLAGCEQHRAAHRIPLHEATRLLMNRCSGLLFATERLARPVFSAEDADFVGRNLAKAKLAFGDVLLAMRGQYHWSCRERHKRLRKLEPDPNFPSFTSVLPLHEQGLEFKLHPVQTSRAQGELAHELSFLREIGRELWLYLESKRLGRRYKSVEEYCVGSGSRCPESSPSKNRLINLRTFGASGLLCSSYPRERLLRSLPLLLWTEKAVSGPEYRTHIQRQLRTTAASFAELVQSYEGLWRIYN